MIIVLNVLLPIYWALQTCEAENIFIHLNSSFCPRVTGVDGGRRLIIFRFVWKYFNKVAVFAH